MLRTAARQLTRRTASRSTTNGNAIVICRQRQYSSQSESKSPIVEQEQDITADDLMARLESRPLDSKAQSQIDLSPELESELNKEFGQFIKDFATEADITSDIIKLVERTAVQGPKSRSSVPSTSSTKDAAKQSNTNKDGNIRGHDAFPNVRHTGQAEPYSAQELYLRRLFHAKNTTRLGAALTNVYKPHKDEHSPPNIRETSISTLMAAGAHLGHSTALFRPSTQPFIHGIRDGIHIIDLDQTLVYLRRASKVVEGIAEKGGIIVFVGTRSGQQRSLQLAAKRAGGYYVHSRWVPGTLTNATEISGNWDRVELTMGDQPSGRELSPNLKKTIVKPDLVVILNPVENRNCIRECIGAKVPTIGIIDTDSEPSLVSYPIPANDDSLRSTNLITGVLSRAAEKGRSTRLAKYNAIKSTEDAESRETEAFNSHS